MDTGVDMSVENAAAPAGGMSGCVVVSTDSPEATHMLGERLGRALGPGDVVLLQGDLGAGKTTFVQGVCHGLGVKEWANSPTFTLINEYTGRLRVHHCDFYRLEEPEELYTLALDDIVYGSGVTLIEWPEVALEWLPRDARRVRITRTGPLERRFEISGGVDGLTELAAGLTEPT